MSAVLDHHGHEHGHDDHAHHAPSGWRRWVFATNHKDIGTMYLLFSFTMFMIGGALAWASASSCSSPGLQYVNPELFNQFTTMHGLIMVFGAIMPAFVGFRELDGAAADRRTRHGLRAHEQPELLAADSGRA
jgi:cytochrome c oxidase subunit 1